MTLKAAHIPASPAFKLDGPLFYAWEQTPQQWIVRLLCPKM